jgi:hypothetical protein
VPCPHGPESRAISWRKSCFQVDSQEFVDNRWGGRRTAKSNLRQEAEAGENGAGTPLNLLGGGPKGLAWRMDQAEDRESRVRQRCERFGQAGPLGVVTILVPPTVLDEMEAVFHLPVATNIRLEFTGRDRIGIQAGHEVPAFARKQFAGSAAYFTINADGNLAAGYVQTLPNILGIVEVNPKPACLLVKPLFSRTSLAGGVGVSWKKQVSKASNISG